MVLLIPAMTAILPRLTNEKTKRLKVNINEHAVFTT